MSRFFEYTHVVGFRETNLVGNVYYSNFLDWQGRCRELFLKEHCPELLDGLADDLALLTSRCSCEYFSELEAFDEVSVRMRLKELAQNRITLAFDYWSIDDGRDPEQAELVARGEQQVVVMRRSRNGYEATAIPEPLRRALEGYS